MKDIEYRHSWNSDETSEQEMTRRFGKLLHEEDTADSYEVAESKLFQKDDNIFFWLQASGCSCWDGDYYGWQLTKLQLIKLGKARAKDEDGYRGASHEKLMGQWIKENIK